MVPTLALPADVAGADLDPPALVDLAASVLKRVEQVAPADDDLPLHYSSSDRCLAGVDRWVYEVSSRCSLETRHLRLLARIGVAGVAVAEELFGKAVSERDRS